MGLKCKGTTDIIHFMINENENQNYNLKIEEVKVEISSTKSKKELHSYILYVINQFIWTIQGLQLKSFFYFFRRIMI